MDLIKGSCEEFVKVLASKSPTPGGGAAAALVGAIGTALGNMVASLTVGKKKYAEVEEQMSLLKSKADRLQNELLELVAKDAECFEPLAQAYGMPKDTPEQQAEKARVMEKTLREACVIPLEIMRKCGVAIELQREFAANGAILAISDAGVGVVLCKAALQGASLNVLINIKAMADREYAAKLNKEVECLLAKYEAMADSIYEGVVKKLTETR